MQDLAVLVHGGRRFPFLAATILCVAAAVVSSCESSTTVTETPSGLVKCQVTVAAPAMMDAGGGTGSVAITTQPECAWTASTTANWISGLSPTSGQGSGNLQYRVAANDGASARDGDIAVNESTVRVSQRAPCRYDVGPASQNMSPNGGTGSVTVQAMSECAWTATTDVGWISLTPPSTGSGNGTARFAVDANRGSERTGHVVIAGQRASITQAAPASACTYTISPTSQNIVVAGGVGTVTVSTQMGCRWAANSNAPWITVTSGADSVNNGTVGFSVAANTGAARTGTLSIGGQTFTITQAGVSAPLCTYSISPTNQSVPASPGASTVTVTTAGGCAWTATSNAPWLTITSGANGTGNGAVAFSIAVNAGPERTGTLTIGGQTYTATQAAAVATPPACTYSIAPPSQDVPATAGTGTVTVTTAAACTWTATSNAPWLTVTSSANGSGSGAVGFSIAVNAGAARSGSLTIGGQTFTVNQAAAAPPPCTFSISPTSQNVTEAGGAGTVTVTTAAGCTWTAVSNAPWLTVTSGASGSGSGSVGFDAAANTGPARTGTLTIGGQTFTVTQAAGVVPPPCTYSIAPTSQNVIALGATGTTNVTTGATCAWTATANVPWLTITSGATGTGNGSVAFVVLVNLGASRTGTLTIAGQTFTVTQEAVLP